MSQCAADFKLDRDQAVLVVIDVQERLVPAIKEPKTDGIFSRCNNRAINRRRSSKRLHSCQGIWSPHPNTSNV